MKALICVPTRSELFETLEEWGDDIHLSSRSKNRQAMKAFKVYIPEMRTSISEIGSPRISVVCSLAVIG